MNSISQIQKQIKKFDIISFDIFDTFLKRPFISPHAVFDYLSKINATENFSHLRIQAEKTALAELGKKEVTLGEIYNFMPLEMKSFQAKEEEFELQSLVVNDEIKEVYEFAEKLNKKIIFTSDTYFSKEFIQKVFNKLRISVDHELYLSSELRITKRDGSLFEHICNVVDKKKILHIGDNFHSDVINAKKNGIKAIHYNFYQDNFTKRFRVSGDHDKKNLELSILPAVNDIIVAREKKSDFWVNLGINFAGPMVLAFVTWLESKILEDNISDVIFVARDGFYLNKIFKKIKNNSIRSHYLYASRSVVEQTKIDMNAKSVFLNYLKDLNLIDRKVAIVDVGTNNFTSQRFFKDLGLNVKGYYWCTGPKKYDLEYEKYYHNDCKSDQKFLETGIIEFFMTSPEAPIKSLDFSTYPPRPVFGVQNTKEEIYRSTAIAKLGDGIEIFANNVLSEFSCLNFKFSPSTIIEWTNLLLISPSRLEVSHLRKIYHAANLDHSEYIKQFYFDKNQNTFFAKLKTKLRGIILKFKRS